MKRYLMKITPLEPYFFGNDKTFKYPGAKSSASNPYFIKSEITPAQTTVIGMLRYDLLPIKKAFQDYTAEDNEKNAAAVGARGFEYGGENDFGGIKAVSAVFITKGDERLIPTPFDHKRGNESYTPLSDYRTTLDGCVYAADFNPKDGIEESYMRLSDGRLFGESEIFETDIRTGINRGVSEGGLFKKQLCYLKSGYSFAAYVLLDGVEPVDSLCYGGQGKSVFSLSFTEASEQEYEEFMKRIASYVKKGTVYLLSDAFSSSDIYSEACFAITDTREYRAYAIESGRVRKGSTLYRLLSAGSVFIPKNIDEFTARLEGGTEKVIGYNTIIKGEG